MTKHSFARFNLAFAFAITLLVGIGAFSYQQAIMLSEASEGRVETTTFLYNLETLGRSIVDAETGQRGFLLTGRKSYLAPYEKAVDEIPRLLNELKTSPLAKKEIERHALESLEIDIGVKLKELRETVDAIKDGNTKKALAIVQSDIGHFKMAEIRGTLNELLELERTAREAQVSSSEDAMRFNTSGILWGSGLGILIMIAAMFVLNRAHKKQYAAEAEKLRFTSLVQNSGDLIAIVGLDRKLEYVNPAGRTSLGLSPTADIWGTPTREIYAQADYDYITDVVLPMVREKGVWNGEMKLQHTITKELIPVWMTVFYLKDADTGQPIGVAAVSRDIRDRKQLERQLNRFFEVSLDMLAIGNTDGYFLKMNPAFAEVLGYTEEEMCSRPATDFIHPDDIQATIEQVKAQADGRTVMSFENRYRTKTGDYRWFSWKSSPDGNLTYGAARDITEEKKQKARLQQLNTEAIAASQAKSEFLANMSHEIRTPINGVVGMTTLLMDSSLNQEQLEYAHNIKASADSLLTVINDILDFSKVEAGKLDIEDVDFNLEHLIDDTAKSLSWATANKSIPFIVTCERDIKHLFRGDPGRIRQVLTNLIGNAIKFTSEGSIRLDVKALPKKDGDEAVTTYRFAVTDTGIGLSEKSRKKLFQPFAQADASTTRRYGGTGLGLSICKSLITLMGGEIGVDSKEQVGSVFWFELRLPHSVAIAPRKNQDTKVPLSKFSHAQILVAEDNVINQKILLSMLKKLGFTAQAVANGSEVLSMLRERPFDIILMDCQMPEMDGYEATRQIRSSQSLPSDIPIIAMTANALKGDKEKCLEAGMSDYATKPISLEALAFIVDHWLAISEDQKKSA